MAIVLQKPLFYGAFYTLSVVQNLLYLPVFKRKDLMYVFEATYQRISNQGCGQSLQARAHEVSGALDKVAISGMIHARQIQTIHATLYHDWLSHQ
jgi:hypothetical protein